MFGPGVHHINACVVEDFGIAPNWLSPIVLRIDGCKYSATKNSSATLESLGWRFPRVDRHKLKVNSMLRNDKWLLGRVVLGQLERFSR